MKSNTHKKFFLVGLAISSWLLLLSSVSLAKSKKDLTIYQKVQLNEAILEPGHYKVEILENAGTTEVAIYRGNDLVVKAPSQRVPQNRKNSKNSVLFVLHGDDIPQLTEIRLVGELVTYQFETHGNQITKKKGSKET